MIFALLAFALFAYWISTSSSRETILEPIGILMAFSVASIIVSPISTVIGVLIWLVLFCVIGANARRMKLNGGRRLFLGLLMVPVAFMIFLGMCAFNEPEKVFSLGIYLITCPIIFWPGFFFWGAMVLIALLNAKLKNLNMVKFLFLALFSGPVAVIVVFLTGDRSQKMF